MSQTHEDPIQSAHEWLEEAARLLGLDPQEATALTREILDLTKDCLLYTSPSPRDQRGSRMPSSA